jgi:hypothetical protein
VELPTNWTAMAADEKVKLVLLNPTSSEYKDVEKNVKSSAGNTALQIVKVRFASLFIGVLNSF